MPTNAPSFGGVEVRWDAARHPTFFEKRPVPIPPRFEHLNYAIPLIGRKAISNGLVEGAANTR